MTRRGLIYINRSAAYADPIERDDFSSNRHPALRFVRA
jgi:hypothetical protein